MAEVAFLREALAHFKQQRSKALDDLHAIETTISQIQSQLGETPDVSENNSRESLTGIDSTTSRELYVPRPDEFFGLSQGDAARALLEKTGYAVSLEGLLAGLRAGGCKIGGADPKRTLYISLVRNTRDFVPVQNGFIGLRKFYPNRNKGKRSIKSEALRAKRKEKTRPLKRALTKPLSKLSRSNVSPTHSAAEPSAPPTPPASVPSGEQSWTNMKQLLKDILNDGTTRTIKELVSTVGLRLNKPIKPIQIYGPLRGKEFERDGEKYRMRKTRQMDE